ncbi:MAG: type IV secretory system conjugative DNA transfer family protein [Bacillota bacterium]
MTADRIEKLQTWLLSPATLVLSVFGLINDYLRLPRPPAFPFWLIIVIILIQTAGLVQVRRSRKAAWFSTALCFSATLAAVTKTYPWIKSYAAGMATNPYTPLAPGILVRGLFVTEILAGLALAFLSWRLVASRVDAGVQSAPAANQPLLKLKREKDNNKLNVIICKDEKTKKPIEIKEHDRYLHALAIGPTGCGKTSRVIKPMIYQDLEKLAKGEKLGITVLEPKGDLVHDLSVYCERLGVPYTIIEPGNPKSARFNPMEGDPTAVAETTRTVLRSTMGKQEAFFSTVQEVAARNVTLLLKLLKGNDMDMGDVVMALQNPDTLTNYVDQLEQQQGTTKLSRYFRDELLGRLKDKYLQFAIGVRQQIDDLMGNALLSDLLVGKSEINLDKHLEGGHVLLIATALGPLGALGDIFGEFIIMHFQSAVFRRPGNEWTRVPHFLYIDEAPRYVNPDMEIMLSMGRSYRCATLMAIQSGAQFELAEKSAFKDIVLTNCRHKVLFGGLTGREAKEFEVELGSVKKNVRQNTYEHRMIIPSLLPKSYRMSPQYEPRYTHTQIMELNQYRMIYRITRDGSYLEPGIGIGQLVQLPKDNRIHEKQTSQLKESVPPAPQTTPTPTKPEGEQDNEPVSAIVFRPKALPPENPEPFNLAEGEKSPPEPSKKHEEKPTSPEVKPQRLPKKKPAQPVTTAEPDSQPVVISNVKDNFWVINQSSAVKGGKQ